ncbi:MAG: orotidine-5'-phosphate decarboxylase [Myxococcales bacterium]|nr:orotidine-5'-phosphate decarboxylase [Myxococcales bacterium]
MHPHERVIVALDVNNIEKARQLAHQLSGKVGAFKIGKELFVSVGPEIIRVLVENGMRVFLDLKFHDIPNTVAGAVEAAAAHGVWMVNVHAAGGPAMCRAAAVAAQQVVASLHIPKPLVIGVTVLTSLDNKDLAAVGLQGPTQDAALRLAKLAKEAGLDGVVASAQDVAAIKEACGPDFLTVTPGIRPASGSADDQKRIMTPAAAIRAGADYLVIGRPITQAPDPVAAVAAIVQEIHTATGG